MLGVGTHDVYVTDRGGQVRIGALTGLTYVQWNRVRDEMSSALVRVSGWTPECQTMLADLRTVRHELVIYRNGVRVWEGPITRVKYQPHQVEIEARDVMWFASRAIETKGHDYSYPNIASAIDVIGTVLRDCFGDGTKDPWGYNVGAYLTPLPGPADPRTSRKIVPWEETVYEIVDKYAEDGGVDYTVFGRRIMWWDTHLRMHVLPSLHDDHFSDDLNVSEYGSELMTRHARLSQTEVTVGTAPAKWTKFYGLIDVIRKSEQEADDTPQDEEVQREVVQGVLDTGFPSPVRITVPANAGMLPEAPVDINDLVPGAWAFVRATRTARQVGEWQKLDEMTVQEEAGKETVAVTFSTAPTTVVEP